MKQISKWFMAMVMITGLALAGCGDDKGGKKKEGDKKEGDKASASVSTDSDVAAKDPAPTGDAELTTVKLDLPHMT